MVERYGVWSRSQWVIDSQFDRYFYIFFYLYLVETHLQLMQCKIQSVYVHILKNIFSIFSRKKIPTYIIGKIKIKT